MLKKSVDEFFGRQGAQSELSGIGSTVTKSDLIVFQLDKAAISDGDVETFPNLYSK
jgi:hypothetical protein